jgi:hypothetical protein
MFGLTLVTPMLLGGSATPGLGLDVLCIVSTISAVSTVGPGSRAKWLIQIRYADTPPAREPSPVRIVVFYTAERWSRDVSDEIAAELVQACAGRGETLPSARGLHRRSLPGRAKCADWQAQDRRAPASAGA